MGKMCLQKERENVIDVEFFESGVRFFRFAGERA
jgi:hypothetical protein